MKKLFLFTTLFLSTVSLIHAADIEAVLDSNDGSSKFTIQDSGSSDLIGVYSNGRLGFGAAVPTYTLDVQEDASSSNGVLLLKEESGSRVLATGLDSSFVAGGSDFNVGFGDLDAAGNSTQFLLDDDNSVVSVQNGDVGVGTTVTSDGSGSGGQDLLVDVEGPLGATHYCDEVGLNCSTPANISAKAAQVTAYASVLTASDTNASISQFNPFSSAAYSSYVQGSDWEYLALPANTTYDTVNGRFNISSSGAYEVTVYLLVETASDGLVTIFLTDTGSNFYIYDVDIDSSQAPTPVSFSFIKDMSAPANIGVSVRGAVSTFVHAGSIFSVNKVN